jgi:NAD(P)-dependent dehydrogenase (short-subunit alcohol dehydrogenase family)
MKTVVMTGGSSGLGAIAAQKMYGMPNTRLILGVRAGARTEIEALPLDLMRLANVHAFVEALSGRLGNTQIDVLVLNAGAQFGNLNQRTSDGFETTFAVNHLAHYLLLRLLLPKLAQGATVLITTSDTHDPKSNPFGPTRLDPEKLACPRSGNRGFIASFRAYSSSKLCNLLTARALAASKEGRARQLTAIAYNPGFTPGTSLFRVWPWWARLLISVARLVRPTAAFNTVIQAGYAIADLALGQVVPPSGRVYASLVKGKLTWPDPSDLARRDDVMAALWRESAEMVGLPDEA